MSEMSLNLYFTSELMLTARFLHLMFENHFESYDILATLLSSQIDIAKLAFAQRLANLKVIQTPLLPLNILNLVFTDPRETQKHLHVLLSITLSILFVIVLLCRLSACRGRRLHH